jgi:hypothetical protein
MRQYLGFGVVRLNREKPDVITIENTINGNSWEVSKGTIPELSACRTPGHVVDVFRDDDGTIKVKWPKR